MDSKDAGFSTTILKKGWLVKQKSDVKKLPNSSAIPRKN
jgi:hypothetical protein